MAFLISFSHNNRVAAIQVIGIAMIPAGKTPRVDNIPSVSLYCMILLAICLSTAGCGSMKTAAVNPSDSSSEASVNKTVEKNRDSHNRGKTAKASSKTGTVKERKKEKEPDIKQQLREAAAELATGLGSIKAMKLCYLNKENEWWVILYRDIGPVIDAINFIWNWEEQRFERYLVVKRIPKNRLHRMVNRHEQGRKCVILTPPGVKAEGQTEKRRREKGDSQKER